MARKKRNAGEINAGSMADIAFLLLIFFLVTTTMSKDKGIPMLLPPHVDEPEVADVHERNTLNVLVNKSDLLLVKGDMLDVSLLKEFTVRFLKNDGRSPDLPESSEKAVISIETHRGTSYDIYIQILNEIKAAYRECRDEYAKSLYNKTYAEIKGIADDPLSEKRKRYKAMAKTVRKKYPMRISEADPFEGGLE
jgi:biopolymer transport protein ExbD